MQPCRMPKKRLFWSDISKVLSIKEKKIFNFEYFVLESDFLILS